MHLKENQLVVNLMFLRLLQLAHTHLLLFVILVYLLQMVLFFEVTQSLMKLSLAIGFFCLLWKPPNVKSSLIIIWLFSLKCDWFYHEIRYTSDDDSMNLSGYKVMKRLSQKLIWDHPAKPCLHNVFTENDSKYRAWLHIWIPRF